MIQRPCASAGIDSYSRAVRRVAQHFDCSPDHLTTEQLEVYFAELVESHSWSTVKIDRKGLQFFWKQVLKTDWQCLNIIKAHKVLTLSDILTSVEVEQLILATRTLHYQAFLLATYSMGLRLSETLVSAQINFYIKFVRKNDAISIKLTL